MNGARYVEPLAPVRSMVGMYYRQEEVGSGYSVGGIGMVSGERDLILTF